MSKALANLRTFIMSVREANLSDKMSDIPNPGMAADNMYLRRAVESSTVELRGTSERYRRMGLLLVDRALRQGFAPYFGPWGWGRESWQNESQRYHHLATIRTVRFLLGALGGAADVADLEAARGYYEQLFEESGQLGGDYRDCRYEILAEYLWVCAMHGDMASATSQVKKILPNVVAQRSPVRGYKVFKSYFAMMLQIILERLHNDHCSTGQRSLRHLIQLHQDWDSVDQLVRWSSPSYGYRWALLWVERLDCQDSNVDPMAILRGDARI